MAINALGLSSPMKCMLLMVVAMFLMASPARAGSPAEDLQASVHRDLSCDTCHSGEHKRDKKLVHTICGQCHTDIADEYVTSVHGVAVAEGNVDAPTCTDCHGEHSILPPLEKLSRVYPTNIAKTTCPQCHASERIITKYNLPGGKVESFLDTYHGLAGELGDVTVANCASCHGVHSILASTDPHSTIHPSNLATTCGKCHPNANENFVKGSVHGYASGQGPGQIFQIVTWFYVILTILVVGGWIMHNGLDYLRKLQAIYRRRQQEPSYPRMNLNERIQHIVLVLSFMTLVFTGFALKFGWAIPFRDVLHRIAGVLMAGVIMYNLFYFLLTSRGRTILRDMWFRWDDVMNVYHYMWYLLGRRAGKPRFGRFTYWEKMEYWAVLWGGIVMGITGFLMWFENWSMGFLPKWGIDLATLIHYLEAILATLAILTGHLYFVVINPDVAPLSFTWITGRIPRHLALEEHPKTYEDRT